MGAKDQDWAGMIPGAIGAIGGMLGIGEARQDRRQVEQQKKLQEVQIKGSKEMGKYNQGLQMDMWNKTNYGAQMAHLKDAGLNAGLIYGMGGAGGATAGSGGGAGVSGGSAADAASSQNANTAMGMQMAQLKLMDAQAEKTKAETEKLKGVDTEQAKASTGVLNTQNQLMILDKQVKEGTINDQIGKVVAEAEKAMFDARGAEVDAKVAQATEGTRIEQIKENLRKTIEDVNNAKKAGNVLDAETAIKGFEANLAEQGIAPNSPWYIKIVTGLMEDLGLGVKKGVDNVKKVM